MKRVISTIIFICFICGLMFGGSISVFADESSAVQNSIKFKAVAAGSGHTVALKEDGTVIAWGNNQYGQCAVPTGLTGVKAVAAGFNHTIALKGDGTVVAWGSNYCDECTIPAGLTGVKAVAAGNMHTTALKEDGTVVAWGNNKSGQCAVPAGLTGVRAVAAGSDYTVALKEDGTVIAWGDNYYGQCTIPAGLSNVKAVAAGRRHTVALKEDGTIVAWGNNENGQCTVPVGLAGVKAVVAGDMHTVALKEDGTVVVWGSNSNDQCTIPAGLSNVKAISSGQYHTVALKEDGTIAAWGDNNSGQCVNPTEFTGAIKAIAAGFDYTVALKENGTVIAWGNNSGGQCTIPAGLSNVKAIAAGEMCAAALKEDGTVVAWGNDLRFSRELGKAKAIAVGYDHIVTLKEDGTVAAWGRDYYGQCTIPAGLSNVKAIAAGYDNTVALKEDGTVVAWGSNDCGQCSVPAGLTGVKAIAAGEKHVVALKEDGTVVAWGGNFNDQCTIPFGLSNVKAVAAGRRHSAALKEDGTVILWGDAFSWNGKNVLPNPAKSISTGDQTVSLRLDGAVEGNGDSDFFMPFQKAIPSTPINSVTSSAKEFDASNPNDISIKIDENSSKLVAVKITPTTPLTSLDYSVAGNIITINKSYLSYFFNKFKSPSQKLNLILDFESGNDPIFTITPVPITNYVACDNPIYDSSNPQNITVNVTGAALKAVKISPTTSLTKYDYSIKGNTVTINKSYLSYFFNKFSAPWVKLNLILDFESGNDPIFTVTPVPITNFITCENPVFDPANPQDISVKIKGNTLNTVKVSPTTSLTKYDYSISGNTLTIKKSYLTYFFNKFNSPSQKLNLIIDFEKGNDPLFTVSRYIKTNVKAQAD